MDFMQVLAGLLNPNGVWNNGGPQNQLAAAGGPIVGDRGDPYGGAGYPTGPVAPQQSAVPVAPTVAAAPPSAQPSAPQGGGVGDFLSGLFQNPQDRARNQTVQWLTQQGEDPGRAALIASNPATLQRYLLEKTAPVEPSAFDQRAAAARQYGLDPATVEGRDYVLSGNLATKADNRTSDLKEYQFAKDQGFTGSFMDWQVKMKEAGRNQVNIDTGVKLPTGYQWIDPNDQSKGVQPIPGGPATQIPAEAAGRIGLADSFLQNFETIKKKVLEGQVTGPIDRFRATNDSSYAGAETYRQIQSGVDSLQRMLTGAGMPASEAQAYAFRYLPGYTDTAASVAVKLDRLKSELEAVQNKVMRGRGGETAPASGNADPLGIR